jgi:hypothetical protein
LLKGYGEGCLERDADLVRFDPAICNQLRGEFMNNIIYIVGLVVIVLFILGFFGLR